MASFSTQVMSVCGFSALSQSPLDSHPSDAAEREALGSLGVLPCPPHVGEKARLGAPSADCKYCK